MNEAIAAQGLGKAYRIYARPIDRALEWLRRRPRHGEFWALRELDLAVGAGEAIGVIGANGAGKSTLLALLTGTTQPTTGWVRVRGPVAAILELGAGMHPEFTGRANARMHASVFGAAGADVDTRVREAIDFSELGDFIDRPVRTYSSGMYVRLAFALAVTVDPEVLIIDEALAVGDQHFQTKCVARILDYRSQGKTIVFCSHNMYQVKKLCDRAIWLRDGQVGAAGDVDAVINAYQDFSRIRDRETEAARMPAAVPVVRVHRVLLEDGGGRPVESLVTGDPLTIRVWVERAPGSNIAPGVGIAIVRSDGLVCYCVSTEMDGVDMERQSDGTFYAALHIPALPLLGGSFHVNVATTDNRDALLAYDVRERAHPFQVRNPSDEYGLLRMEHLWLGHARTSGIPGVARPK